MSQIAHNEYILLQVRILLTGVFFFKHDLAHSNFVQISNLTKVLKDFEGFIYYSDITWASWGLK